VNVHAERLPRGTVWIGVAGTTVLHGAALVALLLGVTRETRTAPPSYAVQLIAAPAGAAPTARRDAPPPAPVPPADTRPAPRPTPARPTSQTQTKAPAKPTAPVTPLKGETPGTGSDIANVNTLGKMFPFPEYLRNLVSQIYRRWNRPGDDSPLKAEVGFVILKDGTVRDIRMLSSSRSYSFDQEALGAVEAAATVKAFGPLPAGYGQDYLQIAFTFSPRQ
jgi:TonB family protein